MPCPILMIPQFLDDMPHSHPVPFNWSDLACYALGVGSGVLVEIISGIVPGEDRS
jgi:hypothetical protein